MVNSTDIGQDEMYDILGKNKLSVNINDISYSKKIIDDFDNDGNIIDYSLLSHAETPGLGSKAADWFKKGAKGDITGKNPGEAALTVSKDGGQIDAITASTITSRAFLLAVNNAYAAYKNQYVDGASGATTQAEEADAETAVAADSTNVENN